MYGRLDPDGRQVTEMDMVEQDKTALVGEKQKIMVGLGTVGRAGRLVSDRVEARLV